MNTPFASRDIRLPAVALATLAATLWLRAKGASDRVALAAQSPVSPVTPEATAVATAAPTPTLSAATAGATPPFPVTWLIILMVLILIAAVGIAWARRRSSAQE